jgi:hypothetical protein
MKIVNSLRQDVWRRFVDHNPAGNIFHTPEMFEVFRLTEGHHPTLWAAVNSDNYPLALLLPVEITLAQGLLQHLTRRAVVYGSVLFEHSEDGLQALKLVLSSYVRETHHNPVLYTELRNLNDLGPAKSILLESHFAYIEYLDFLIDLDCSKDVLLERMGSRTRKSIRRALHRQDIIVEELNNTVQLQDWYDVLRKTYSRARVPLAKLSLFEAALELLGSKGFIRFTQARVGTALAAVSVELLYKKSIYGWYGGADRSFTRYRANEFLMWHILAWGSQNGYSVYDFGGAGKPGEKYGVRDFKAKFGGKLVSYGRNTFTHRPVTLWFSKLGYEILRGCLQ